MQVKKIITSLLFIIIAISANAQKIKKSNTDTIAIKVMGNCGQCKERIEEAAYTVSGVKVANWNKKTQELTLIRNAKKATLQKVQKAIAKAGHDTDTVKATDAQYSQLPSCCAYRSGKCEHDD
jgi:periplasmic mercuric ion binding protein